ncbi:SGNH/GDSL hydrolase family protein [Alteraurantiacibacter palmitatis]|uniref:SGNH/GDSL hydrolase family protein n=1 Tax=Alteraurantiacibacter palmitatis TaxID=2054628 RepID=A0ABV7E1H1_9SPHN
MPPSDQPPPPNPRVPYPAVLADQTVRMIARVSTGGDQIRLEFANRNGAQPVLLGKVHSALANADGSLVAGSGREVHFSGSQQVTVLPGARVVSDPVDLSVPPLSHVAVSIHLPEETLTQTVDAIGLMPTFVAAGDQVGNPVLSDAAVLASYFWLRGISVPRSSPAQGAIIAFGDSITEGYATPIGANQSWPDILAERLQADPATAKWSVINTGISGNRLLRAGAGDAGLARFTDDVLSRPGAEWAIVLLSINDINMSIMPGMPPEQAATAEEIIAGLDQLVTRAHFHGLRIAGATVLPTKGLFFYSAEGEAMRQQVNEWIRASGRFDAVIDFDAATRDPVDPLRLNPVFNPGDHVHPNNEGNRAMAEAIDLGIFGRARP